MGECHRTIPFLQKNCQKASSLLETPVEALTGLVVLDVEGNNGERAPKLSRIKPREWP
jgi:hypothetical protein